MGRRRAILTWTALTVFIIVPIAVAAVSPLLAWRQPIYIAAGFAGVVAMSVLLVQPLLAEGRLPGLTIRTGRIVHRWIGVVLVALVLAHVAGLWITSPPDVIDALTFTAPTAFSAWGVIAMWAVFASAILAVLRKRLRPLTWRRAHMVLAAVIVTGSVVHAMLIEGTMGIWSKAAICAAALAATGWVLWRRRALLGGF